MIRELREGEWDAVAGLIFESTNGWYERNLNKKVFQGEAGDCRVFPEVYEGLDPGCCLVAEVEGVLMGSCFYHPRETHVSVGIVNVREGDGGRGVARRLMEEVIAKAEGRPVRLVSSLMNLDSYSLYTRLGFVPTGMYQDMYFPEGVRGVAEPPVGWRDVREDDVADLVRLEEELCGIRREKDFRYFVENEMGIWRGSVVEGDAGLEGFLFAVDHAGSRMLGPGVMRNEDVALGLIGVEAQRSAGGTPVFLVPTGATGLVRSLYAAGARNCELHVSQVLGEVPATAGVSMPTFLPETG